jgi:hypothetical protein
MFQTSPLLSNFANWVSGAGANPSINPVQGGSIAYAPQPAPVFYNRNFESLGSQTTFGQPQVTPYDIVGRLAANSPQAPGSQSRTQVTAEDISGGVTSGGLGRTLLDMGSAVIAPVRQLLSAVFSSPRTSPVIELGSEPTVAIQTAPVGRAVALGPELDPALEPEISFEERLLKLGVTELLLLPGDPREVFDRIEDMANKIPTKPSNPFLDGVLVRTDPWDQGSGGLSGYFALGSGGGGGGGAPRDSTPSPSASADDGGMRGAIQGAMGGAKPKSAFSAMRLSLGTIADALKSLFKNFFDALFWWL